MKQARDRDGDWGRGRTRRERQQQLRRHCSHNKSHSLCAVSATANAACTYAPLDLTHSNAFSAVCQYSINPSAVCRHHKKIILSFYHSMNRKHEFKTLINEEDIIKVWLTGRLARPEKNLEPLDTPLRRCHLSSLRLQTKGSFE